MITLQTKSAILDLSLTIEPHEFLALSGKSGSGKTTLLRTLAGLEPTHGRMVVNGVDWTNLAVQKRNIGFVFQDYALFPNLNVIENLLYIRKDKAQAEELLEMVELTSFANRPIQTLSGGQKQRVALARALMSKPSILLLDEPLSALDSEMRHALQDEIKVLHKRFNLTTIMVSHEPSEIYKMADRMLVLEHGHITKEGSPKEVLLGAGGSQKFSFTGEVIDIFQADVIHVALVAVGAQLVEIVLDRSEAKTLKIGSRVNVGAKAFGISIG